MSPNGLGDRIRDGQRKALLAKAHIKTMPGEVRGLLAHPFR